MAVTGEQPHVVAFNPGEHAITVELDFIAPVASGRGIDQGCKLRLKLPGQGRFLARAGPLALGRRFGAGTASRHQRAIADHAVRLRFNDAVVGLAACLRVVGLDQHPLLFLACQTGAEQVPHAAQLLSLQAKAQLALGIGLVCVTLWLPDATIPDDHIAGAIVTLRDIAFEIGVFERVILYVHR
ncbi:hypothetical protein D3C81_980430 [compost metagenome]